MQTAVIQKHKIVLVNKYFNYMQQDSKIDAESQSGESQIRAAYEISRVTQ